MVEVRQDSAEFDSILGQSEEIHSFEKRCKELYEGLTNLETGLKLGRVTPKQIADRLPVATEMVQFMEQAFASMVVARMDAADAVDRHFDSYKSSGN